MLYTHTHTHTHTPPPYFCLAHKHTHTHTLLLLNSQFSSQTSTLYKSFLDPSKEEFANETLKKFSLTTELKMT